MKFSDITNKYVVLKIPLDKYSGTNRILEEGFEIAGAEVRGSVYKEERKLLKLNFQNWKLPFNERLIGWRKDSPIYVLQQNRLVGGIYICEQNEFAQERWGQAHYNFIATQYRGRGIYSILFNAAMCKALAWELKGLILNTDRYLHPDLYQKWGGFVWKTMNKPRRSILSYFR